MGRFHRFVLACLLTALVAACAGKAPPPPVSQIPSLTDPRQACLATLRAANALFEEVQDIQTLEGCAVENAVKVSAAAIAWNRPGVLACPMAQTLIDFEKGVVQPLAWRHFSQPVVKIHHAGTYNCRNQRGRSRLSMHAMGMAIDITAFELADGSRVSVLKDWKGAGAKSAFLQDVSRASCDTFNVVLTPNHDRDHKDHLHLDIGPYKLCGM